MRNNRGNQLTLEWKERKKWNPFNSFKLLAHVDRWKQIQRGNHIPSPVLITVDPANLCNLGCVWCNAKYIRDRRNEMLSEKTLFAIADFLPHWGESGAYTPGVQAVCIAGGGEPLMNPATPDFIERLAHNGIEIGVVTNGSLIHTCMDALCDCTWVGCSVDAATEKTFNALKGLPKDAHIFTKIIDNLANLVDRATRGNQQLGKEYPSYGVSYKFLLYKDNISEVYQAAKLAKSIGCKSIHFRPAGTTWDNIETGIQMQFSKEEVSLFEEQIRLAQELDDESFGVYGITHKFNMQFGINNAFSKCYAVFMTALISPPTNKEVSQDAFTLSLCCDRRGDERLELLQNCVDVDEIERVWGSKKHWQIFDGICVTKQCPRCTYQPHNQIYEEVIQKDSMTYKFI